jgi:hypothetical protein
MSSARRFAVQELCPRIYTRDAILSAVVTPKLAAMRGHLVWEGDLRPVKSALDALKFALSNIKDRARLGDALSKAVADIAEYGRSLNEGLTSGSMEVDFSGALTTGGRDRREPVLSIGDRAAPTLANFQNPAKFKAAVAQFYADPSGQPPSPPTLDRRSAPASIADMNATNKAFWSRLLPQTLPYWKRPWGRG